MLRTLLQIDIDTLEVNGFDIQILKDCSVIKNGDEPFINSNTAILLVKSGGLRMRLREVCMELSAQDLVVLTKGQAVEIIEISPKLKLFYLAFTMDYATKNCNRKALTDAFYISSGQNIEKVQMESQSFLVVSIIYMLMYQINNEIDVRLKVSKSKRVSFNLFLYEIRCVYRQFVGDYHLSFSRNENLTSSFLRLLACHFKEQHSAKFYATVLFVTTVHLNRVVKQTMGKTVKKTIEEALGIEAKNALEDTQKTIGAIALELGFESHSSFSTFFKKYAGVSAIEYRSIAP